MSLLVHVIWRVTRNMGTAGIGIGGWLMAVSPQTGLAVLVASLGVVSHAASAHLYYVMKYPAREP